MGFFQRLAFSFHAYQASKAADLIAKYAPYAQQRYGSGVMIPRDGRQRSTKNYLECLTQSHALATSTLRLAEAVSACPIEVQDAKGQKVEGEAQLLLDLLKKPNPLTDWPNFIETLIFHLIPTGRAFILKDPIAVAGNPMELWLLRPDMTAPVMDKGKLAFYDHTTPDGRRLRFKAEQVEYLKLANPFDPLNGLGRAQLIETALDIDIASGEYNAGFFERGASVGTVIEADKIVPDEKAKLILAQFKEMYDGYRNAHRTAILDNGMKLSDSKGGLRSSPKEADWLATRRQVADEIGGTLSVPPIKRGNIENANRSNSVIQDEIFIRDGVCPLITKIEPTFVSIAKLFNPAWVLKIERPTVDADETKMNVVGAAFDRGAVTPNDIRVKVLGWKADTKTKGMDSYYMALNYLPIEAGGVAPAAPAATPADQPATGTQDEQTTEEGKTASERLQSKLKRLGMLGDLELGEKADQFPRGTDIQRRILAYQVRHRPGMERRIAAAFKSFWQTQEELVVARWMKKNIDDVTNADDNALLTASVMPIYKSEMGAQFSLLATLFEMDSEFKPGSARYVQATGRLARKLVEVSTSTKDQIEAIVREGMNMGLTPEQIANGDAELSYAGIRGTFASFRSERAQLVARTEGGRVQDQAALAAYDDMSVKVLDVIGCKDFVKMPGQSYGCNSQGVPAELAKTVEFHPNHAGAWVPRLEKSAHITSLYKNFNPSSKELEDALAQV